MDKIDFKRSLPSFRAKQGRFDLIEVPESQYLMIDGQGGHVDGVMDTVRAKGSAPRLGEIRFDALREGTCVQTLHIGPFDDEGPVLKRMHTDVVPEAGMAMAGKLHEIYLSDVRRTAPEKLRTILRQPVAPQDHRG